MTSKVKILVKLQKIASDSCGFQGEAHTTAKQLIEVFYYVDLKSEVFAR